MSSKDRQLSHQQASGLIERLEELLRKGETCEFWQVCGSFRRGLATINDVDIVAVPRFAEYEVHRVISADSLFSTGEAAAADIEHRSMLWHRVDELLAAGTITQALYGDTQVTRWGEKLRGFIFEDVKFEIDTTDQRGYGVKCVIRTGEAEFSQMVVTKIKKRGIHRVHGGYLRPAHGDHLTAKQKDALDIIPCPSEADVFAAAGMIWTPPAERIVREQR